MAIYEYCCEGCGRKFELKRSIVDAAKTAACPTCGKEAKRLYSAPHVVIK